MKKVSFMVAFLALLQSMSTSAQARQEQPDLHRSSDQPQVVTEDRQFDEKIKQLLEKLNLPSDQLGESLEQWAQDNSQELQAWKEKYSPQWKSWSSRFQKSLEKLAGEQEGHWRNWAQDYEQDLKQWMDEVDSNDLNADQVGELIKRNLEMVSRMPLGQLVDQALKDGVGEIGDAPWASLAELGQLASAGLRKHVDAPGQLTNDVDDHAKSQPSKIQDKIDREKSRFAEKMKRFNEDLKKSNLEPPTANRDAQSIERRKTKRPDGKNATPATMPNSNTTHALSPRPNANQQTGNSRSSRSRSARSTATRSANRPGPDDKDDKKKTLSDRPRKDETTSDSPTGDGVLDSVRAELKQLRAILKELKKERDQ